MRVYEHAPATVCAHTTAWLHPCAHVIAHMFTHAHVWAQCAQARLCARVLMCDHVYTCVSTYVCVCIPDVAEKEHEVALKPSPALWSPCRCLVLPAPASALTYEVCSGLFHLPRPQGSCTPGSHSPQRLSLCTAGAERPARPESVAISKLQCLDSLVHSAVILWVCCVVCPDLWAVTGPERRGRGTGALVRG